MPALLPILLVLEAQILNPLWYFMTNATSLQKSLKDLMFILFDISSCDFKQIHLQTKMRKKLMILLEMVWFPDPFVVTYMITYIKQH